MSFRVTLTVICSVFDIFLVLIVYISRMSVEVFEFVFVLLCNFCLDPCFLLFDSVLKCKVLRGREIYVKVWCPLPVVACPWHCNDLKWGTPCAINRRWRAAFPCILWHFKPLIILLYCQSWGQRRTFEAVLFVVSEWWIDLRCSKWDVNSSDKLLGILSWIPQTL